MKRMKNYLTILFIFLNHILYAQVGIGTTSPQATLDIAGKPTISTSMDGMIPPRLTGNELNTKTYTTAQKGAIVFITSALSNTNNGQCANVTNEDYYYFDGSLWQNAGFNESISTLNDVDVTTLIPNVGDKLVWDGVNWSTERAFFTSVSGGNGTTSFGRAFTTYICPDVDSDTSSSYNATTGTITLANDGLYLIQGTLRVKDKSPVGVQFGVGVHTSNVDGPWFLWHAVQNTTNGRDRTTYPYSRLARFNANDQLRMFVYVDDTTGLIMTSANFSVYKLSD